MAPKIDLYSLRKSIGLKQTELAKKVGIKQAYLSEIETGKKPITNAIYNTLVEEFGEEICDNFAISQEDSDTEQNFFGDINGGDNNFSGRDMTINPPCSFGFDIDKVFQEISAQRKLTEEAQAQTRKAQEQMDRLLTIIENLNKR